MNANKCIECTVKQCANHAQNSNYCSLDRIMVGTHECNPPQDQCTDCLSIRKKCRSGRSGGLSIPGWADFSVNTVNVQH